MIRIHNIKIPLDYSQKTLVAAAAKKLSVAPAQILSCEIAKKSVDARKKNDVCFVVSLDTQLKNAAEEKRIASRLNPSIGGIVTPYAPPKAEKLCAAPSVRPVVIGFGPAGLFAALTLAQAGACPIILERGQDVDTRTRNVHAYWENGKRAFNPRSNVQFGEGGAGTFSDGKLNTGTKDPRGEHILRTFVRFGAPHEILINAKPHIGTDKLVHVVKSMREEIIRLGGEVHFGARMTNLIRKNDAVSAVVYEDDQGEHELPANHVILAIGHSARDTFTMLHESRFSLEQKPFSIGARIEHPQQLINRAQYGDFAAHPALGAADYKLALHLESGRSVYTFCMCPGGSVVASASEPDSVVTNGMSCFARDLQNANSALLVGVEPADFGSDHPLAGMFLQREIEQKAFAMGGCTGHAPAQLAGDLIARRASTALGSVVPSYRPGIVLCDLSALFPGFIIDSMREALPLLGRKLRGFDHPDAVLTAPETRSSSPVRIPRGADFMSVDLLGLYPCGEGAGYAGGITSAAVDGVRCAEAVLSALAE
ncbi:MAG: FAD-dependent oxidoreductase [Clostridia bacterium]|nr:FAD-dependent oxidoreductase [Clostridia bacterium]